MKAISTTRSAEVEALVRKHQGSVRGFLIFLGCPADRLDDLVQDVFLSVLSARFEHRGDASTAAFLRKVARNLFFKMMRRENRGLVLADAVGAEHAWVEFERDDGGKSYVAALRECLRGVGARAAQVLGLRYEERMPLAAIGRTLGLTESGIKSVLVRTKKRLRECIERRLR